MRSNDASRQSPAASVSSCTWQRGVNLGSVVPHPTTATSSMTLMLVRGRTSWVSASRSKPASSWPSGHQRRI
jgi:hypothetical protein